MSGILGDFVSVMLFEITHPDSWNARLWSRIEQTYDNIGNKGLCRAEQNIFRTKNAFCVDKTVILLCFFTLMRS